MNQKDFSYSVDQLFNYCLPLRDFFKMNTDIAYHWFALYTKPRAEKKVYEDLQQMEVEVYLPMRKELRQWSDRKKWIDVPVISSYIFVHIQMDDYRRVFESKGILSYVSHKGKAVVIPDREIEAMRRTVESNLTFNVETSAIRKGQTITIASGPLKGITGEVLEVQGARKFFLRISHIGYTLVVNLDDGIEKPGKKEKQGKKEKKEKKGKKEKPEKKEKQGKKEKPEKKEKQGKKEKSEKKEKKGKQGKPEKKDIPEKSEEPIEI